MLPLHTTTDRPTKASVFAASIRQALADTRRPIPSDEAIEAAAVWIASWRDLATAFRARRFSPDEIESQTWDIVAAYENALAELPARVA